MTPFEIDAALEGMVVLCDTRERDTPFLRARLSQMKCPCERRKLDWGDYSAKFPLPGGGWLDLSCRVAVERKMDFGELALCYCSGRKRFTAEFERAKAAGAKLYLLVEGASWERAYKGEYRSKMAPRALVASVLAWLARYDCQIIMCEAKTSGRLIRDILYREGKELLEALADDDKRSIT